MLTDFSVKVAESLFSSVDIQFAERRRMRNISRFELLVDLVAIAREVEYTSTETWIGQHRLYAGWNKTTRFSMYEPYNIQLNRKGGRKTSILLVHVHSF